MPEVVSNIQRLANSRNAQSYTAHSPNFNAGASPHAPFRPLWTKPDEK